MIQAFKSFYQSNSFSNQAAERFNKKSSIIENVVIKLRNKQFGGTKKFKVNTKADGIQFLQHFNKTNKNIDSLIKKALKKSPGLLT